MLRKAQGGNPEHKLLLLRQAATVHIAQSDQRLVMGLSHAPTGPAVSAAEVERRIRFADAALGAAGHQVSDPAVLTIHRRLAAEEISGDDPRALVVFFAQLVDNAGDRAAGPGSVTAVDNSARCQRGISVATASRGAGRRARRGRPERARQQL
ncbi:hypothetical protein E3T55_04820 [Cryobacterium frigoriphilum]|uniref:Uncharacterized protein n=1 Tax=Cryobacterium frigoriphilum TaxID=1259150 RepID=A0A4R9A835_9MICO|nr:hypothetical protein E3T55_04820 [Cryobacterium frigoriphilum]